jgi:hypothetical protein
MERLLWEVADLYNQIAQSDHPNADALIDAFDDNYIPTAAWPTHVISHGLEHPERWETGDWGIRYKKGKASG